MALFHRVYHTLTAKFGTPDAFVVHPDGAILWRIHDKWFFKKDCVNA